MSEASLEQIMGTRRRRSALFKGAAGLLGVVAIWASVNAGGSDDTSSVAAQSGDPPAATCATGVPGGDDPTIADAEEELCVREATTTTSSSTTLPPTSTTVTALKESVPPPTTLTGVEGTLSATVRLSPVDTVTAQLVTLQAEARDEAPSVITMGVVWGDSKYGGIPGETIVECNSEPATPKVVVKDWTSKYSYRVPGRYPIRVVVTSSGCDRPARTVELTGLVAVSSGAVASNGPQIPRAHVVVADADESKLHLAALDPDGWIRSMSVDFGDGSPPRVFDYGRCTDPVEFFPGPSERTESASYRYQNPGSYLVTLAVTGSGCDGRHEQSVTSQATVVVN